MARPRVTDRALAILRTRRSMSDGPSFIGLGASSVIHLRSTTGPTALAPSARFFRRGSGYVASLQSDVAEMAMITSIASRSAAKPNHGAYEMIMKLCTITSTPQA